MDFLAGALTITVYRAMSAGLLSITLDLLPATLITCPCHSPALLMMRGAFAARDRLAAGGRTSQR